MKFSELKSRARVQLKGNYLILFLCYIILLIITGACSGITYLYPVAATFGSVVMLLITGPTGYGMAKNYNAMSQRQPATIERMFTGFKECFLNSFLNTLLVGLFVFLWSLLLFIPGIIKAYAYSMSMYIQADNPQMSAIDCITESRRIMNGNKGRLFLLNLSFIGWILLGFITAGIGFIWIGPYITQTQYNFYLSIKRPIQPPLQNV